MDAVIPLVTVLLTLGSYAAVRALSATLHRRVGGAAAVRGVQWGRRLAYLVVGAAAVAVVAATGSAAALRAWAGWLPVPLGPAAAGLLAVAAVSLGPTLAIRLATLPHHRRVRRLDVRVGDIGTWFVSRYLLGTLAFAGAAVAVVATPPGLVRAAAVAAVGLVGVVTMPTVLGFAVRARRPTAAERAAADLPDDVRLRVVDDRTRLGVAVAAGVVPGYRDVLLAEAVFETLSAAEVRAVAAHELGHHHRGHLLSRYGASLGGPLLALAAVETGVLSLPLAALALVPYLVAVAWLLRRTELSADDFAADRAGAEPLAAALERLAADRLVFAGTGGLLGWLGTYPTVPARVRRLRARAARTF